MSRFQLHAPVKRTIWHIQIKPFQTHLSAKSSQGILISAALSEKQCSPLIYTVILQNMHDGTSTKGLFQDVKYMHLISFQAQIWTHCKIKKFVMAGNGFWMSDFVHKQKRGCAGGKYSLFSMSYMYQKIGPRSHVIFAFFRNLLKTNFNV